MLEASHVKEVQPTIEPNLLNATKKGVVADGFRENWQRWLLKLLCKITVVGNWSFWIIFFSIGRCAPKLRWCGALSASFFVSTATAYFEGFSVLSQSKRICAVARDGLSAVAAILGIAHI